MLKYYIRYPVRLSCFACFETSDNPSKFRTICSPYPICQWLFKEVIHYLFCANYKTIDIRICCYNLFQGIRKGVLVAVFSLMVHSGILGLVFVKFSVILQVSFVLLVSNTCKVLCQMFDNCSLIAYVFDFQRINDRVKGNIVSSLSLRPKLLPILNENTSGGCNQHKGWLC